MNRFPTVLLALLTALTMTACTGTSMPGIPDAGAGPLTATPTPADAPGIDACTLFTEAELTDVLGEHQRKGSAGHSTCQWENSDYHSVSIDVGSTGTAPGGVVPEEPMMGESEKGDGGLTYYTGGYTTFAVGDRVCRLQIVTDVSDPKTDRPAIDRFAALIKERL